MDMFFIFLRIIFPLFPLPFRSLSQKLPLQAVDEGADCGEGAQLFVGGQQAAAGVEQAEDVAERQGEGQAGIADVAQLALKGMDRFAVDPYFDFVIFFISMTG